MYDNFPESYPKSYPKILTAVNEPRQTLPDRKIKKSALLRDNADFYERERNALGGPPWASRRAFQGRRGKP